MLVRSGILLVKYWFSVSDEEQERRFQARDLEPDQALEAQPDGPPVPRPLGGLLAGQGRDVSVHGHQAGAVVGRPGRRQGASAAELHPSPARHGPLHRAAFTRHPLPARQDDSGYMRPPVDEQTFVPVVY